MLFIIGNNIKSCSEVNKDITKLVEHYIFVMKHVKTIENIFNFPIFCQCCMPAIVICITILQMQFVSIAINLLQTILVHVFFSPAQFLWKIDTTLDSWEQNRKNNLFFIKKNVWEPRWFFHPISTVYWLYKDYVCFFSKSRAFHSVKDAQLRKRWIDTAALWVPRTLMLFTLASL